MSNEIEKTNIFFAFGFAMFLICIGLFSYFLNDNNIIKIIAELFFTFGFMGLGFELQNLGLRAQYILVSGFPFLLISIMYREYIWIFIIFMSLSMSIFFSSLVEFLLNFRNKKDNINLKIEGIISIIGSLLTIISSILSIVTNF
jgi:hypothetical protein